MDKNLFKRHELTVSKTAANTLSALDLMQKHNPVGEDEIRPFEFRMVESNPFYEKSAGADLRLPMIFFDDKTIGCFSLVDDKHKMTLLANIPDKAVGHINKRIEAIVKQISATKKMLKAERQDKINQFYDYFGAKHQENAPNSAPINLTAEEVKKAFCLKENVVDDLHFGGQIISFKQHEERPVNMFRINAYNGMSLYLLQQTKDFKAGRALPIEGVEKFLRERVRIFDERYTPEVESAVQEIRDAPVNDNRYEDSSSELHHVMTEHLDLLKGAFDITEEEHKTYVISVNEIRLMSVSPHRVTSPLITQMEGDYNLHTRKMSSWLKRKVSDTLTLDNFVDVKKMESELEKEELRYD